MVIFKQQQLCSKLPSSNKTSYPHMQRNITCENNFQSARLDFSQNLTNMSHKFDRLIGFVS